MMENYPQVNLFLRVVIYVCSVQGSFPLAWLAPAGTQRVLQAAG